LGKGLSDMSVAFELRRRHSPSVGARVRAPRWKMLGEEFQVAMQEGNLRNRSKVGRMARLRGELERAEVGETRVVE
jgi:hypothetical protein